MYKKWLVDIEESMNENGSISVVSPRYWTIFHDDVTWPAAYFYVADMLYRQFGDDSSIQRALSVHEALGKPHDGEPNEGLYSGEG